MTPLEHALAYRRAGLSTLPIKANGTKAPALDTWDELKTRLPTPQELHAWYAPANGPLGVGVIGGAVSGGLAVLDFEYLDLWEEFAAPAAAALGGTDTLSALPLVRTPGKRPEGGRHLYFRTDGVAIPTGKLARFTPEEAEARSGDRGQVTAIEVKGEGGYVLAPGCPPACHPSGRTYEQVSGLPIADVPTMPAEQLDAVLSVARSCDRAARQKATGREPGRRQAGDGVNGTRPGDEFNRGASWRDILPAHGWECVYERGEAAYWRRPGKAAGGIGATTGFCTNDASGSLLYVFTTNAPPFEDGRAYSKFSAWALLNHGGDWSAAARALANAGWGKAGQTGKSSSTERNGHAAPPEGDETDATAADLIRVNATLRWQWKGWIPIGVLTILASEPGIGKTRLCADLLRRIYKGLPWPDGSPATLPPGTCALWVAADNQHPELGTLPGAFGFPPEALYLNTPRAEPFGGTMLDDPEDLKAFERRIARVKPGLVFVDTCLNATDRSSHKPEDAKAFFVPLQQIAARAGTALVCVTHLNAAGKPLGRRIEGQGRVVIMLERPDPDGQPTRRKLYVRKSNDLYPEPLGVTMGAAGNEYDRTPPREPETVEAGPQKQSKLAQCINALTKLLENGPQLLGNTRKVMSDAGFSTDIFYRAMAILKVQKYIAEGLNWIELPK